MAGSESLAPAGRPCPSCGMTTSFAWFARGNIVASLYVQPMGTILATLSAAAVWVGLYIGVTGKSVHRLGRQIRWMPIILTLMFLWLAAWGWKIGIHVRHLDGWPKHI